MSNIFAAMVTQQLKCIALSSKVERDTRPQYDVGAAFHWLFKKRITLKMTTPWPSLA